MRTAADTQRSQHRAFLKSGEVNSVEPRGVKAAVNIYRQNTYTVVYDRLPKPSVISVLFCFSLYCSSRWIRSIAASAASTAMAGPATSCTFLSNIKGVFQIAYYLSTLSAVTADIYINVRCALAER